MKTPKQKIPFQEFQTEAFQEFLQEKLLVINNGAKYGQVILLAGGSGCFDGETLVKTEKGYKKISEILPDELVWTMNEKTKELELKPVQKIIKYTTPIEDLLEIVFENGEKVICTASHEFLINGQWIKAKDL